MSKKNIIPEYKCPNCQAQLKFFPIKDLFCCKECDKCFTLELLKDKLKN